MSTGHGWVWRNPGGSLPNMRAKCGGPGSACITCAAELAAAEQAVADGIARRLADGTFQHSRKMSLMAACGRVHHHASHGGPGAYCDGRVRPTEPLLTLPNPTEGPAVTQPVVPEMPRGIINLAASPQPDLETGPPCAKCGVALPPLPPELASVAATTPVVMAHEVCPGTAMKVEGRYFEVRVTIVEVNQESQDHVGVEELITFRAGGRWPDLDTAMRPLALKLGEKWASAERQARLADADPAQR